jgi:Nitroreductase family
MQDMNGERVTDAEVQQILEAANWAPTHGKTEPWRFAVLSSPEAQHGAFNLMLQVHSILNVHWKLFCGHQSCVPSHMWWSIDWLHAYADFRGEPAARQ